MEPEHKAMIVISHPWEFVPKGSSHFNYQTSSAASNSKLDNKNMTTGTNANIHINQDGTFLSHLDSQHVDKLSNNQLEKNHLSRAFYNPVPQIRKNIKLVVNSEEINSNLNEFSFSYLQKSPLLNKFSYENSVKI